MSKAKIRTCSKCGCGFMKSDGCNKVRVLKAHCRGADWINKTI